MPGAELCPGLCAEAAQGLSGGKPCKDAHFLVGSATVPAGASVPTAHSPGLAQLSHEVVVRCP